MLKLKLSVSNQHLEACNQKMLEAASRSSGFPAHVEIHLEAFPTPACAVRLGLSGRERQRNSESVHQWLTGLVATGLGPLTWAHTPLGLYTHGWKGKER